MTLEEARTALPWLQITQRGHIYDLYCTACKGLETFSLLMLRDSLGGDLLKVKPVRFHLYCGKDQDKGFAIPEASAASVDVTPRRQISLTDE